MSVLATSTEHFMMHVRTVLACVYCWLFSSLSSNNLLPEQDVQAPNQSPLYYMNEMRNHNYGDMWPDVDRMSYEVFVTLNL